MVMMRPVVVDGVNTCYKRLHVFLCIALVGGEIALLGRETRELHGVTV